MEIERQEENDRFIPRIFASEDNNPFPESPDEALMLNAGQLYTFSGLQYSPADQVSISWKVNGVEMSKGKDYTFSSSEIGEHRVSLEVSYQGITTSRTRLAVVLPSEGVVYERKPYNHVVLSYLTPEATYANIRDLRWDDITHVAYKTATVTPEGLVDYTPGFSGRKIDYLVYKAHTKGVPVLLGISGTLSLDGWSVWGDAVFASALRNPDRMANIVHSIASYISYYNMDGIEVRMADVGNDVEAEQRANIASVSQFLNALRTELGPDAIITVSVAPGSRGSSWQTDMYRPVDFSTANWVNIRAYGESGFWGNTGTPPVGYPLGQPWGFSYMEIVANRWKAKQTDPQSTGIRADKLVIGMPAIGVRHLVTSVDGNGVTRSGGWGATNFNFMPYRDIISQSPVAYNEEFAPNIAKGVYYNGVPLAKQKAQYVKDEGFLGVYLWGGNYDATDEQASLTKAVADILK